MAVKMIPEISLVGITGYGKTYVEHLMRLHAAGLVRLVSAVVVNPDEARDTLERLQKEQVRILPDMDALCAEKPLDWICLPVGIPLHRLLTEQALSTGANVLLEKPAAGSVADWQAIREAEEKAGRKVMIGFQHLHNRQVLKLKHELVSGAWGAVKSIDVRGEWPRADAYYQRNAWAGKKRVAGVVVNDSPIQNAFAHYLNLALYFAGDSEDEWAEATSVSGRLLRVRPDIETFDNCELNFRFSTGVDAKLSFKHATRVTRHPVIRITTTKGWVEVANDGIRAEKEIRTYLQQRTDLMQEYMFRDVLIDRTGGCSLERAGHHVRAVELVMNSLEIDPAANAIRDSETGQWLVADESL
jgi:predicted dehydrogenase